MVLLPVIGRELRAAARHPFTYHLRLIGAATLVAVSVLFGLERSIAQGLGSKLFALLHLTLFCAIWILVPLLTADCISRERREGTLALLFLTPLSPHDIVLAKGLAHGLRAFTLWLAVLPILTIPFIAGGVSATEALLSVMTNLSSLFWALGAGLIASALNKSRVRALAFAAVLAVVFLLGMLLFNVMIFTATINPGTFAGMGRGPDYLLAEAMVLATNWNGVWGMNLGRNTVAIHLGWLSGAFGGMLGSFVTAVFVLHFAGWNVRRIWREEPPSARVVWLERQLFTPMLFQSMLHRWMRWKLHRNPIGWLEQRTWSGRLVTWSWFAVVISIYSAILGNPRLFRTGFHELHVLLAWLLMGSMAVSAAGSFRRERESGVLELLLVAPLTSWQIINGRLRGLWGQFLPSIVLLVLVWGWLAQWSRNEFAFQHIAYFVAAFISVPVIGLYFSLARDNFMSALLWTFFVAIVIPAVFSRLENHSLVTGMPGMFQSSGSVPLQIIMAIAFAQKMLRNLDERKFALDRRVT